MWGSTVHVEGLHGVRNDFVSDFNKCVSPEVEDIRAFGSIHTRKKALRSFARAVSGSGAGFAAPIRLFLDLVSDFACLGQYFSTDTAIGT